jgi:hypothetical protein
MMKKNLLFFFLIVFTIEAKAQQWLGNYPYVAQEVNHDHVGIFAELGVNSSSSFVKREGYSATAKGALSIIPKIGLFYQKGLGERFSIRGGLSFGKSSFAYKYAPAYDTMTDDQHAMATKKAKYVKVKHPSAFVQPQIDLGYLFGPVKKIYMIEVRAGVGLPMYLGKSNDSSLVAKGVIRYKGANVGNLEYYSTETAKYGEPDTWGLLVADAYIGVRWKNTDSPFLNRSGLGITATIPISITNAGYSQIEYKEQKEYYYLGVDKINMGIFSFGVRYVYNFL